MDKLSIVMASSAVRDRHPLACSPSQRGGGDDEPLGEEPKVARSPGPVAAARFGPGGPCLEDEEKPVRQPLGSRWRQGSGRRSD
jgi:hypothetical protein